MDSAEVTNACTSSTTFCLSCGKVRRPAGGPSRKPPKASSQPSLGRWERRKPLSVVIQYRGGSECWWQLRSRGRVWRFPGHTNLHDALDTIMGGDEARPGRV